ncbi:MAG: RnfABCDGE type electron transport complex subunit C [Bacilli bacterium]|jgi:electron transport complex protein RnfC
MFNGVKVDLNKNISITKDIKEYKQPKIVYIPLNSYGSDEGESLVKINDYVLKGQVIGQRSDQLKFPLHSSVSGQVVAFEDKVNSKGELVKCLVIKNDFKEKQVEIQGVREKLTSYNKEIFLKLLKECAVSGMGGADFPTYLKYKGDLNTIIVNVVEGEPYMTSDYMVGMLQTEEILEALDAIMEINQIKKGIIALNEEYLSLKERFEAFLGTYPNIMIVTVPAIYPLGWERYLVKKVLNVHYNKYPLEKGIVVNNINTIYAIYKALKNKKPISQRIITISGEMVKEPQNVLVKLGTSLKEVIEEIGGLKEDQELSFIVNGPLRGKSLKIDDLIVTKDLAGIVIQTKRRLEQETTCLRCGKCALVCPVNIVPILIKENLKSYDKLKYLFPERCLECGLCSYICPSKINIRESVRRAKKEIRRH